MDSLDRIEAPAAPDQDGTVFIAFELSKAKWQLGIVVPGATAKLSRYSVAGGDTAAVAARIAAARAKAARGGRAVRVVSLYEAGYDGFWLHRWLTAEGVINYVVDAASIQVNRRARRAKTDRLDLEQLMRTLLAYCRGEPKVCSMAPVPSIAEEDARRRTRERQRLIKERGAHVNRIKALLHAQGIRDAQPRHPGFAARLGQLRTGDGHAVPPALLAEMTREHARLRLVAEQIATLEAESRELEAAAAAGSSAAKVHQLTQLVGIGPASARLLVNEVFYRRFDNRRQLGGYFGLTGTPYDSGAARHEQGIGKSGNPRARTAAIELAWLWRRHQPSSALSRWFDDRVGILKGGVRKTAIAALARKLMVALWRYLESGLVPNGARLRAAVPG
jgi:transposase